MSTLRKISLTVLIAGLVAGVAGLGAFSAFTATTSNTGNTFASGTVEIGDNDASAALYTAANQGPGTATVKCITITYTGTLAAHVELFQSGTITNGTSFNLLLERGAQPTPAFSGCTGFVADAGLPAYNGALGAFPGAGVLGKAAGAAWATGDSVTYRFTLTVVDDTTANAHTAAQASGSHNFTWEARNN
jgi:hypothetical protein